MCFDKQVNRNGQAYFVDVVGLERPVEASVHAVEHGHDLHGIQLSARLRETDHITEQDGTARNDLVEVIQDKRSISQFEI